MSNKSNKNLYTLSNSNNSKLRVDIDNQNEFESLALTNIINIIVEHAKQSSFQIPNNIESEQQKRLDPESESSANYHKYKAESQESETELYDEPELESEYQN
ncbi:2716_t:CDS:1, partial [Gigaspora margarita]